MQVKVLYVSFILSHSGRFLFFHSVDLSLLRRRTETLLARAAPHRPALSVVVISDANMRRVHRREKGFVVFFETTTVFVSLLRSVARAATVLAIAAPPELVSADLGDIFLGSGAVQRRAAEALQHRQQPKQQQQQSLPSQLDAKLDVQSWFARVSAATAKAESFALRRSKIAQLVCHSISHLCGHTHDDNASWLAMRAHERDLLAHLRSVDQELLPDFGDYEP